MEHGEGDYGRSEGDYGLPEDLSYMGSVPRHPNICGPSCSLYTAQTERGGLCQGKGVVKKGDLCGLEKAVLRGN